MYLIPEKELYTLIQLFYSGHHEQISNFDLDAELDFSNPLYKLEALLYKARSTAILNKRDQALELVQLALRDIEESLASGLVDAQSAEYVQFEFNSLAKYIESSPIEITVKDTLGSMYAFLSRGLESIPLGDNLELATFQSVLNGDVKSVEHLKDSFSDALILDFAGAWLGLSVDNEDFPVKGSYYFFDELCSSSNTSSTKTWGSLLICHLKMGHLQEAQECLQHLKEDTEFVLVAKIAIAAIQGENDQRQQLTNDLVQKYPNSSYVNDLNEKNALFDQVVASF